MGLLPRPVQATATVYRTLQSYRGHGHSADIYTLTVSGARVLPSYKVGNQRILLILYFVISRQGILTNITACADLACSNPSASIYSEWDVLPNNMDMTG